VPFGPRVGLERGGTINVANSGSEHGTGIGVVTGFGAVVLLMPWPHGRKGEGHWVSKLRQRLQEVRSHCKTRNQLILFPLKPLFFNSLKNEFRFSDNVGA
jgi:hypothetical protein